LTTTPERHDPFAALRQPSFRLFVAGRVSSGMASMLLNAAVFWQVYEITGSKWQLGIVGLVRFIPSLGLSLVAGAVADSYDRRKLAIISQGIQVAAALVLLAVTLRGGVGVWFIYACVFVIAMASTFEWPARQALLPMVVKKETFPNAIVVSGVFQQLSFVSGPALGGLLIWLSGVGLAYAVLVGLLAASIILLTLLRPRIEDAPKRAVNLAGVMEGIHFVRSRQVVLGSMTLDMFAVIFGGATALLPVYANDILDVGPAGYGLLLGSIDGGAFLMSIAMVAIPPVRRPGRALLFAVAAFGIATIVFGLSRSLPLSILACLAIGMSDEVSVVMRQTTIQLATPDELRGRVTSVNMLFIGASNQLGAVESGFVAAATSATFAVVSGGLGCLAVLGVVGATMRDLWRYRTDGAARPEHGASLPAETPETQPATTA
jgi:MFS family permease